MTYRQRKSVMPYVFQQWLAVVLVFHFLCFHTISPEPTARLVVKKIPLPDHVTGHKTILCWTIKFQNDAENFYMEAKKLNLKFHSNLEFDVDHQTVCYAPDSNVTKLKDLSNFHHNIKKKRHHDFRILQDGVESFLDNHPNVEWYTQETVRSRQKRSVAFVDPYFTKQWHLVNRQISNMDINITGVWERNVTGHGVTVAVVDDGIEWTNPDLKANYNSMGSWDLNDNDADPMPSESKANNHHGTRCAGEIAAVANNDRCGVGVAYTAKVSGLRVLDGPMTDSLEASAFNKKLQINDVYSCSWGPDDDGKTVDGPHILAAKAMKYGVDYGRRGYGSIFVVASGNGGRHDDNCNFDGYANSIYTVTIGAVDEIGHMPYYAEKCASMLGVTFSSGKVNNRDIVTTDWTKTSRNGCTVRHTGTSAAAPLAAGMIALMLQVRPCLTWRDVQYIIILTALKVDVDLAHWQKNGAGLDHSHKHGFGLLKAWRLVNAAKIWEAVPWLTSFTYSSTDIDLVIPKDVDNPLVIQHTVSEEDVQGYNLYILEYVQVTVTITHPIRGKLSLQLQCPSGTNSVIAAERPLDVSNTGFSGWTFTTVRCWGEQPVGTWNLTIKDSGTGPEKPGTLKSWRLRLFGSPMSSEEFQDRRRKIEKAMSGEYLNDSYSLPCRPPPETVKSEVPITLKTLKVLVLASAFCAIMAVYETLEYCLCYNAEKREHRKKMELALQAQSLSTETEERVGEEDVTESTGLLQGEDIQMTALDSNDPDDVIRRSDIPVDLLQKLSPDDSSAFSHDRDRNNCDNSIVNMNQSGAINCDHVTIDRHAQFDTLSLSDDEEETTFDVRQVKKSNTFDWLKYTKNG